MNKIGAITIGQSPRVDMVPEILPFMQGIECIEKGALDGMTKEEIAAIAPQDGDYVLVTRLVDGSSVQIAERHILPRIQKHIDDFNAQGIKAVLMLCTGQFPPFNSKIPVFYPEVLQRYFVLGVVGDNALGILSPNEKQIPQSTSRWTAAGVKNVLVEAATPYADPAHVTAAGLKLKERGAQMIVMDCMGYNLAMKKSIQDATGLPVVLPRTVAARFMSELYGENQS